MCAADTLEPLGLLLDRCGTFVRLQHHEARLDIKLAAMGEKSLCILSCRFADLHDRSVVQFVGLVQSLSCRSVQNLPAIDPETDVNRWTRTCGISRDGLIDQLMLKT